MNVDLYQLPTNEQVTTLESDKISIYLGQSSGSVRKVGIKNLNGKSEAIWFEGDQPFFAIRTINGEKLSWKSVGASSKSVEFIATDSSGYNYHISYIINSSNGLLEIELSEINNNIKVKDKELEIGTYWHKSDSLANRQNTLEFWSVSRGKNGKMSYKRHFTPSKQEKYVPRGTIMSVIADRYFCEIIKFFDNKAQANAKLVPVAQNGVSAVMAANIHEEDGSVMHGAWKIYIGPRDYFHLKESGVEDAFPIGFVGKIGLVLVFMLNGIAAMTKNYGAAIIILSGSISLLMAPFTILGFRSMKKMQELKPHIDKLLAEHKGDSQRANKEVFALYKENKVSPLSGCLPMFIQMPIFIALFQAISHHVGLRGAGFLWIKDLSLPDMVATLPVMLPLLGNHLNILPIIMASAMYAQSKISQGRLPKDPSNPAASMLSGPTMSIVFGIMFYQFPSGLVLYWLTNTLTTLMWYKVAG